MAICLPMLAAVILAHLREPAGVMFISTSGWPVWPMSARASLTTSPLIGGIPSRVLRTGISSRYSCLSMVVGFWRAQDGVHAGRVAQVHAQAAGHGEELSQHATLVGGSGRIGSAFAEFG